MLYGKILPYSRRNWESGKVHKKFFNALYALNIFFQGFLSLIFPIALSLLISWIAVDKLSAPEWIYAPIVILGVVAGLCSMIRFIIAAGNALERLEAEQKKKEKKEKNNSGNNK